MSAFVHCKKHGDSHVDRYCILRSIIQIIRLKFVMGSKTDAWIEGNTPGYRGENAARPGDRVPLPAGRITDPRDRQWGYLVLERALAGKVPVVTDEKPGATRT